MTIRRGRSGPPRAQRRFGSLSSYVGRACATTTVVAAAILVGGIGLGSASATVAAQQIAFTSTAPTSPAFGSTYTVAATASSGLPVTLTVDPSASNVCSLSGATVKFTGVGTCTIDANQAGNATYAPATQVQQSTTDGPASQTITITSAAPVGQVSGGASYSVAASSSFGLPITFAVAPSSSAVCSVSGSTTAGVAGSTGSVSGATVNFIGAGTCTIDANQPGNAFYLPAKQVQQSFAVAIGLQAVRFSSSKPTAAKVGGSFRVAAYAGSGLPVTLAVAATSNGVCSLSEVGVVGGVLYAGTVKLTGTGTCAITAAQPGNSQFSAALPATQSVRVAKTDASGLTVTVKHDRAKLVVSGRLKLPKGIKAAQGYRGTVTVTGLSGKKAGATGKLSTKTGKYSITLSRGAEAKSLTVRFSGNTVLAALTKKHTLS
jgi:hypothetical protein